MLVPVNYNDGTQIPATVLSDVLGKIYEEFDGSSVVGTVDGTYRGKAGEKLEDTLLQVWVVVREDKLDELRDMVRRFAVLLQQESMYFEVIDSRIEFIEP